MPTFSDSTRTFPLPWFSPRKTLVSLFVFAAMTLLSAFPASAQGSETQNSCINAGSDSTGATFENTCSFRAYNNYIEPGGTHQTYHRGSSQYYTCAAGYFVVDPVGVVVTHQVSGYHCRKP